MNVKKTSGTSVEQRFNIKKVSFDFNILNICG